MPFCMMNILGGIQCGMNMTCTVPEPSATACLLPQKLALIPRDRNGDVGVLSLVHNPRVNRVKC